MWSNPVFLEQMAKDRQAEFMDLIKHSAAEAWDGRPRRSPVGRRLLLVTALIVLVAGSYALGLL